MIISIDSENAFNEGQHLCDKSPEETRNRRNSPQHNKSFSRRLTANMILSREKLKAFLPKSGIKLLFIAVLEVLTRVIRQEKGIQIEGEEVKSSPFADYMILYSWVCCLF